MLTVKDMMYEFQCKKDKALSIMKQDWFPSIKVGKSYYVDEEEFQKWKKRYSGKELYL